MKKILSYFVFKEGKGFRHNILPSFVLIIILSTITFFLLMLHRKILSFVNI